MKNRITNKRSNAHWRAHFSFEMLRIMKFTIFLIVLGVCQVKATIWGQEISISVENAPLQEVFHEIRKQSGYDFIYTTELINQSRPVTLHVSGLPVSDVLNLCLANQPFTYMVDHKTIILRKRIREKIVDKLSQRTFMPIPILLPADTLRGLVQDENGEPLIGVNVQVKGTTKGTATDFDGRFELINVEDDAVLVFSYVGYQKQEVALNGRKNIDVALLTDSELLDEVVVVGYGSQSRMKMSTAVSKISGKEINRLPVTSAGDALAGLAAGVQIQSGVGGVPGSDPIIRIRGIGSLGADNSPLIVVDGYPLPDASQFARLDVNDIESIEVLKDAASASIYGSRAANGVIVVSTKKGTTGNLNFSINAYSGIQNVTKTRELMNLSEYVKYSKDAFAAVGKPSHSIFNTPDLMANTDWQDIIFRTAPMSEVKINAEGGSEKIRFFVSGNYRKQKGVLVGTDYQVVNFRTNLEADLADNVKIGVNFSPSFTIQNRAASAGSLTGPSSWQHPIYSAMITPPYIPVKLKNGDYANYNDDPYAFSGYTFGPGYNPLGFLELYENKNNNKGIFNNIDLSWEPVNNLLLKTHAGIVYNSSINETYIPSTLRYTVSPNASLSNPSLQGIASSTSNVEKLDWLWENTLNYSKIFKNQHNFNFLLLFSLQKFRLKSTGVEGAGGTYLNDIIKNPSASSDLRGTIGFGLNSFVSFASRLNYDYKDKYLFSSSIRSDGSSRFGSNNRYGIFKSISLGWRISEENFMSRQNLFDELKIRVSYGETGNANIGDFVWRGGVVPKNYSYGTMRALGLVPQGFSNRNLTWEKNNQVDIGIETSFFRERFYFILDFYEKTTNDMLFPKELPAIVGYAQRFFKNIGEIKNQGIEFDLTSTNIKGSFNWITNFNMSFNKTQVIDLGGRDALNAEPGTLGWGNVYKVEVGQPLGNMYGFIIDGVFKNQGELESYPSWSGSGVGDYRILDVNRDGDISEGDRTLLGNGFPDFIYGMTNSFSFKGFEFSFIFQGVLGNQIIDGASRHSALWAGRQNAQKDMANNYFDPNNPNKEVKYARVGNRGGFSTAGDLHSYAVYDGDYLRLRNLTFGYTLSNKILKRLSLKNIRIYITGQNMWTLTKYPGYNPEPSQYGDSVYQPGSDQGTYPVNNSIILGINLNF